MSFPIIDDFLNLRGYHYKVSNPSFPYNPLNTPASDIRLVELHSGGWEENVEVTLSHALLDGSTLYEALSYTWGNTNISRRILVNGHEFRVTENLEIGLRHLRAFGRKLLWIDAICINQNDAGERAEQVSRMKAIYDQASRVVVWLGAEADDSNVGMERMRELRERHKWHLSTIHNYVSWDDAELVGGDAHPETLRAWKAISQIFNRPWFSRAWIVQEVSGTKNLCVICGTQSVDFVALTITVQIIQELITRPNCSKHPNYTAIEEVRQAAENWLLISAFKGFRLRNAVDVSSILYLLEKFWHFDATDLRDKVYATLNFQADVEGLKADYTLSLHQVYAGLVESYIKSTTNLDILGYCRSTDTLRSNMSCWIPYWGSPNGRSPFTKNANGKRVYSASGSTVPEPRLSGDLSTLTLRGFHVDTIVAIARPNQGTQKSLISLHFSILGSLPQRTHSEDEPFHYCHTNEPLLKAYYRTIVADFSHGFNYSPGHRKEMKELASSAGAEIENVEGLENVKKDPHRGFAMQEEKGLGEVTLDKDGLRKKAEIDDCRYSLKASLETRRFFLSARGYIGLVPEEASEGFLLCILDGGAVPYVLWQSFEEQDNRPYYQFIGEAYVHGLMDGEAMIGLENGLYESREFPLV